MYGTVPGPGARPHRSGVRGGRQPDEPGVHTAPKRARRSPLDTGAGRGRTIVFSYVPALDGLRAVAVLGVMLYHGGAPVVGGGFLGVDVFFVLSGLPHHLAAARGVGQAA